jgi:hypothetical protein
VFPLLDFHQYQSLFGLVLAIGLVVDDAIVVVEAANTDTCSCGQLQMRLLQGPQPLRDAEFPVATAVHHHFKWSPEFRCVTSTCQVRPISARCAGFSSAQAMAAMEQSLRKPATGMAFDYWACLIGKAQQRFSRIDFPIIHSFRILNSRAVV